MRVLPLLALACLALPALPAAAHGGKAAPPQRAIERYAARAGWQAEALAAGLPAPVLRLRVPSPFGRRGSGVPLLPDKPHSTIYRFKYLDLPAGVEPALPFRYVEIDWNTEGEVRGPNGSFVTPHFDFHFYTRSRDFVEREMHCISSGNTCDSQQTRYVQMRRFLDLPPPCFFPAADYFPDTGSSIAQMGLHSLDGSFDYSKRNVDANPVIIYGSFDGELAFLEASLTLHAFSRAAKLAAAGGKSAWPIRQPAAYAHAWWPTGITLEYLPGDDVFIFELNGFAMHPVQAYGATACASVR
ncbi:hypothetical protein [Janthinobacterium fluminis]|uniref:DUF3298 domain-containing protein n=1 Tax=Janthinobacterium fluminis TaxID=2987524 RepID=A0ABT5K2G4_9BURK|nr:hypothetical protein [Janthinobacterium fluminis]MDC8759155.1 hypothetical protein [Janthinobacterium fluminis]